MKLRLLVVFIAGLAAATSGFAASETSPSNPTLTIHYLHLVNMTSADVGFKISNGEDSKLNNLWIVKPGGSMEFSALAFNPAFKANMIAEPAHNKKIIPCYVSNPNQSGNLKLTAVKTNEEGLKCEVNQ